MLGIEHLFPCRNTTVSIPQFITYGQQLFNKTEN